MSDWWWTMEFVLLDVAVTVAVLIGYLALVIRRGNI
jgi:hypothetical protein